MHNNYLHAGEQFDEDLGQNYLRARYLNPDTGRFLTFDSHEGNNEDPLSLHKYLYCHANPVNGTDPTGNMFLMDKLSSMSMRTTIAVFTLAAGLTGWELFNRYMAGDGPDPGQQAKINRAINLIRTTGGGKYTDYASRSIEIKYRVVTMPDHGKTPVAYRTIWLQRELFEQDDRLFASVLIHELTHTRQLFWPTRGLLQEGGAYQVQSDFLRDVGIHGEAGEVIDKFPDANEFLMDLAGQLLERKITSPAIYFEQ